MASLNVHPANITFNEMQFAFPSNAKLHSINESRNIFAYLMEEDELIISKSYQIHIIRLDADMKHKTSEKLPSKPNDMKFITIHNASKSMKKKKKKIIQYSLVIAYDNGSIHVMDTNCAVLFTQHISNTSIKSISLHFDNCFYSYCPSLLLNCHSDLLFITADEIYRTLSISLRDTLNWSETSDMDAIIATLWSPKKIILTQTPSQIVDIISIPPIDLMKHGIKRSLLDPEPPLNLYTSNQLFLIIVGYQPCITYVQIEKSSKGFGVREIKQGANKLVKSAFNLVTKSMSFGGVFSSFWGASNAQSVDSSDDDDADAAGENHPNINARSAAMESIRNLQGTRYKIQCVFKDEHRKIEQVILSPLRRYAALIDSYGRISVLDCKTLAIIRLFKGCRGAQCGWIQLDESSLPKPSTFDTDISMSLDATAIKGDKPSKTTSFSLPWTVNKTLLFVIYIAPRGILEIYHLSIKHRLGALLFNLNGLLLYHLSLFEQSKYHCGDPSHIFLCDHSGKQSTIASTFSLQRFTAPNPQDIIALRDLDEEQLRFGGSMYELQINIDHDAIKAQSQPNTKTNALLTLAPTKSTGSATSSACRYSPITFIHPANATNALKVSTQNEEKEEDSSTDSTESDDDDDDDIQIPSGNMLNETNFEDTFFKYLKQWKLYMADIPNALVKCLNISSESDLIRYWNILLSIELKQHSDIATFCDFLSHVITRIIAAYSSSDTNTEQVSQFQKRQIELWMFRKGCITSYSSICSAYIKTSSKEKVTLSVSEWSIFWISHYMKPMSEPLLMDTNLHSEEDETRNIQVFSQFMFGVIALDDNESFTIPPLAMKSMSLPSAVLSLYLELFLFWFVTEQSHKWLWNAADIEDDIEPDAARDESGDEDPSRWQRMTKAMKLRLHRLYEEKDASTYPGYHWKYLLDHDSLSIWLDSNRVVSGFGDIKVDWTNKRYDEFLSNPLNLTEQRYLPTLQYFVNTGAQLLGLLRDYVQNTTQLTHAFLICRVTDYIYNDDMDEESDCESIDPVNNEWIIKASRILKAKIFSYLLDYNHHSENYIASLNTSQNCYMISLKKILENYYRSGYSLNDIEEDLPVSRLVAKYILSQMEAFLPLQKKKKERKIEDEDIAIRDYDPQQKEREKEIKLQQIYAQHQVFIETLLFVFDVMDYTASVKSYDYDGIVRYVALKQKQLEMEYLDEEFMQSVLVNIYYVQRIVPQHINLEWLIFYCLFDIYEAVVSQENISQQLILLHKFQTCGAKILQVYASSNMNVLLQIIVMNGQLWFYVLSSLLNRHVLKRNNDNDNINDDNNELQKDIITTSVEWIKFVSNIIESLIVLQQQNKHDLIDSNTIINNSEDKKEQKSDINDPNISNQISALKMSTLQISISNSGKRKIDSFLSNKTTQIGQGYKREQAYLYEDKSELASWPPKATALAFIYDQYLQPGTLLFFSSRAVIYTAHLKSMFNLYLQILRLYFVSQRAKISVIATHFVDDESGKKVSKKSIYLYDIFPDFAEFDTNLFSFEWFQSYTRALAADDDDDSINKKNVTRIKYDGVKAIKFKSVMMIAKRWIAGALDLSSSWNLDVNKVKRYIITELCNNYKDEIGIQLMKDDLQDNNHINFNDKHVLALSLLHVVKKRTSFFINQLLHSPQHQHLLAGIPADCFQELLHYNDGFNDLTINEMNQVIKMSISNKDKKEIKQKPNKVLQRNLKLTLAIDSLLQHDDFYEKKSRQEINTLVQIINLLLMRKK